MQGYDLIVVGGGIIGLTAAYAWLRQQPNSSVLIIEKESNSVHHGSGRNSGVIHSGLYYTPDSLRARLCVSGAALLRDFVDEQNLWSDPCGKLLLPTSEASLAQTSELIRRAKANKVPVERLDAKSILKLEPRANIQYETGVYVPQTRVTDPKAVVKRITDLLTAAGVQFHYSEQVISIDADKGEVKSSEASYQSGAVINAAGLFSDQVAQSAGLEFRYEFQPFKGKYWRYTGVPIGLKHLIYAIPDLNMPFLGVHSVHNAKGDLYFGPSSTPVLGRENYLGWQGLAFKEASQLAMGLSHKLLMNTNGLRALAFREMRLLSQAGVAQEVGHLVRGIDASDLKLSDTKVGIRSQIFDPEAKQLVTDFVTIGQGRVLHVLNAISPAFSASFAFADYLVAKLLEQLDSTDKSESSD